MGLWEGAKSGPRDDSCRFNVSGEKARTSLKDKKEEFALRFMTVNVTSWGSAKELLLKTSANIVFLQEHKLVTDDEVATASSWANNNGWFSIWSRAQDGENSNNASGGTAVLAREGVGIREVTVETDQKHRVVAAVIEAPETPEFVGASAYFDDKLKGMKGSNASLLGSIRNCLVDLSYLE